MRLAFRGQKYLNKWHKILVSCRKEEGDSSLDAASGEEKNEYLLQVRRVGSATGFIIGSSIPDCFNDTSKT